MSFAEKQDLLLEQNQKAILKLHSAVSSRRKSDGPINSESQPPQELEVLWEKCGDHLEAVAVGCCEVLVSLVQNGQADFEYVLRGMLNVAPTARNLVGIASALTDLLAIQHLSTISESKQPGVSYYGIRSRPHPFVTMVTSRPDSWPILLHQVRRVLTWPQKSVREYAVTLLQPFLRFVILEPNMSPQFVQLRMSLPRTLLRFSRDDVTKLSVISFLEDLVSCLQIKTISNIGEAIAQLELLSDALLGPTSGSSNDDDISLEVRGPVACHCLSLSVEATRSGLDNEGLVSLALALTRKGLEKAVYPRLWLLTARLLLSVSEYHVPSLLVIVRLCLNEGPLLPRHLSAMMILPLIQVISTPPSVREERHTVQARASQLLQQLNRRMEERGTREYDPLKAITDFNITAEGTAVDVFYHLTKSLESQPRSLIQWLAILQTTISHTDEIPPLLTSMVAGICCLSRDSAEIQMALDIMEKVSTLSPEQGSSMLPLLMFCLTICDLPELRLQFLNAIPKVARHKVSVAPTLKTLQLLGSTPSLKPTALKLTTSLWKHQDRCFPYLQKMLQSSYGEGRNLDTNVNEFLVTKALSIRDICEYRPSLHGADMLAPLSAILNDCASDEDSVPAALALEGISHLCQAEVVDIRTVWKVLSSKLSQDKRPNVVRRVCELFSLVPTLAVNTPEYEEFRHEILESLWIYSQSKDDVVAGAAYRALACFPREDFTVEILPGNVTEDVREAITAAQEAEESVPEIPGVCFVRLLEMASPGTLPAIGDFLVSLVNEEVAGLPRGIYHAAISKRSARRGQGKALATIPEFLIGRYERNKQPGLRSSLASGLLFGYDPQLEAGRDGKIRRPTYVAHGRSYHQMLYTLLNEIVLQPTDWHRCMSIPQAWVAFMERCYHAYLEGRRAELGMAFDQGQVNDPEEHQLLMDTAWLWCRDKLTDLIKSTSRGGPSVQANCLLALSGLAVATSKFASGIDDKIAAAAKEATEYLGHTHWLSIVANTMMSILDPKYEPTGRIFTMCQQHPGQSLSSASALARGGVCMALPLVVPILITINTDIIYQMMDSVVQQLPGQARNEEEQSSSALHFFYGLGLGMLLARLFVEHFADVAGSQGESAVWKAVYALEEVSFSDHDNRLGSLIGLSVCVPALCNDGKIATRVHINNLTEKLTETMKTVDHKDLAYTGLSLCVATIAVAAYSSGLLGVEAVNQSVATVHDAHCNDLNDAGLAVALAGMCHGLQLVGHPTINQLTNKLEATWITCAKQEDLSLLQKLCVLQGLLSLAGADANHFLVQAEQPEVSPAPVNTTVILLTDLLQGGLDLAIQTSVNWRLGQLYLVGGNHASSNLSVPSSYQYLPDTSILRPIIECIIRAGKSNDTSTEQLEALLRSLCDGPTRPLPPVNWTSILTPILRQPLGENVTALSLRLAVRQAATSPSASLLLASWMLPPLWNGLNPESKMVILNSLDVVIKSVPAAKLREFFNQGLLNLFKEDSVSLQIGALKGFCSALKVPDPPQSVTLAMYQTLEKLYQTLPNEAQLFCLVSECLREVPDQLLDTITRDDFSDGTTFVKSSYVRCYLVSHGNQPLAWLNPALEMALWENDSALLYNSEPKGVLLELGVHCFYHYRRNQSEATNPVKLSQWLLELMGHVKNVTNGVTSPPEGMTVNPKTVEFGMLMFAALVVMTSTNSPYLLNVVPMDVFHPVDRHPEYLKNALRILLPKCLSELLGTEPWKRMAGKIIDWMISMYNCPQMDELPDIQAMIKSCLRALRHTNDFKRIATWSQVYCL